MRTESIQLVDWFMEALCPGGEGLALSGDTDQVKTGGALETSHHAPQRLSDLLEGAEDLVTSLIAHYRDAGRQDLGNVLEVVSRAAVAATRLSPAPEEPARLSGLVYPVL